MEVIEHLGWDCELFFIEWSSATGSDEITAESVSGYWLRNGGFTRQAG